ncbi:WYL domain-containing protein [Tumidithrix elongata RA019]|uniref:WYL domain-containing protein n=1 Tax=Tumidithrix elongata BACA0141 TaxID=2716417 RepID=A0AAW9PS11_9CYAN|nr:WYL domain-containing protein [Tumidithrix elongata RA019]
MPKPSQLHPYSDLSAFERLLLLIATFVHHPGVGCPDRLGKKTGTHHEALEAVRQKVCEVAQQYQIPLTDYAIPTLRKDLTILRKYGILSQHIYRWGYFLGTGAMTIPELQIAMNALASMATYQRSPQAIRIYRDLENKLRGLQETTAQDLLYPVRSQIDRAIIYTNPDEMLAKPTNRHNLFSCLDAIETAIYNGQAIELYRHADPYAGNISYIQVVPLQLLYHDIAWYLLYEYIEDKHIEIERIDRFRDYIKPIGTPRDIELQKHSLKIAHDLLQKGWGLYLGDREEQALEKQGMLKYMRIEVRFFEPAIAFIQEGENRHPFQKIGKKGKDYLDYAINLPPRSLNEFCRWLNRFMDSVQVRNPPELVSRYQQAASRLAKLYDTKTTDDR